MGKNTSVSRQGVRLCTVLALSMILTLSVKAQIEGSQLMPVDSATLQNAMIVPGMSSGNNNTSSSANRIEACVAATNDAFANAITLTVNAAATAGTTCSASIQVGEDVDCNTSSNQSVWYSFNSGANTTVWVIINTLSACYVGSAVWQTSALPTGSCPALSCQNAAYGPSPTVYQISTTINTVYYIQILYASGGPCGADGSFNVQVKNTSPGLHVSNPVPASSSSTCATAYSACYLNYCNASYAQVSGSCPAQTVSLQSSDVYKTCYTFTNAASNAQVGIQAYLTTTCGLGNVNWLDWTLYDASCNLLACGNLSNLQVTGAGCNKTYTVCQEFELANCTCSQVIPYASWSNCTPVACTVLPIELASFNVDYQQISNTADIYWSTATEKNNKMFYVERSVDGNNFTTLASVPGAGNSSEMHYYTATDENPYAGVSYYRLKQVDFDGLTSYSQRVPLNIPAAYTAHVFPNPTTSDMTLRYSTMSPDPVNIVITDISGKVVSSYSINEIQPGINDFNVQTSSLAKGMYFMKVSNEQKTFFFKFVKQ